MHNPKKNDAATAPKNAGEFGTLCLASPTVEPAWDEAFLRVESYLHAHHVESRTMLNHLAAEIIREARTVSGERPADAPVAVAMQITHARIATWFARAGSDRDWTNDRDRAHGRLALVVANLPGRWSHHFLSAEPVPAELTAAMASFQFQPGPELRFTNMPTAPLEFGTGEDADPRAVSHGAWGAVRAASSWLILCGLIGVAWAASH